MNTDKKIDLTKLWVAEPMTKGSIDDHILVHPKCDIGKEADLSNRYTLIHKANFHLDVIPTIHYTYPEGTSMLEDGTDYHTAASQSNRRWNTRITVAEDLDRESAITTAKEYAVQNNLPVYFGNKFWTVEVIQKPEGWEPHIG
ncbi:MAG: hypothetical protein AABX31_02225 [Nanoarchaeota archaeon]